MTVIRISLAASLLAILLAQPAAAQSSRPAPRAMTPRKDVVKRHYGVRWHSTLEGALKESKRRKKPLLWLRMLGRLDGGL